DQAGPHTDGRRRGLVLSAAHGASRLSAAGRGPPASARARAAKSRPAVRDARRLTPGRAADGRSNTGARHAACERAANGCPCIALQGLRWASLIRAVRRIPRFTAVAAMYVGQAASAFLPMRAGEAVRMALLARATGIGRSTSLGTVALDHSVNGVVMFSFAA